GASLVASVTTWPNTGTEDQLVAAEYFWDTDPGAGNGSAISGVTGQTFVTSGDGVSLPTPNLRIGTHQIAVRVKNAAGVWSEPLTNRVAFTWAPSFAAISNTPLTTTGARTDRTPQVAWGD